MLVAQIADRPTGGPGKLFKAPLAGPRPDSERVLADIDTAAYLTRAVATLNALEPRPDITIITGDLCDHGEIAEYENLRDLLTPLQMPVFLITGNHDSRAGMRALFGGDGYLPTQGFLQYAIDDFPLRIVALDTLAQGVHPRALCSPPPT